MTEILKALLHSAADSLPKFSESRDYPPYKGFEEDARNMRGDFAAVGTDMRKALKAEKSRYAQSRSNG